MFDQIASDVDSQDSCAAVGSSRYGDVPSTDADLNLIEAQHARAIVEVDIDGSSGRYQSVILQVDPRRGTILIDELFPEGFSGLPGQPMTITVRRMDGSRSSFATRVIERRKVAGIDNYLLKLPGTVAYQQRREVFRLHLGRRGGVASEFQTADRQFCAATVHDLSVAGIRLELQNDVRVAAGDVLTGLDFDFQRQHFSCQARVRHVYHDRSGSTIVGAAFDNFPRLQLRVLERLIMQHQRLAAKQLRAATDAPQYA